jgi:hypothetical protein
VSDKVEKIWSKITFILHVCVSKGKNSTSIMHEPFFKYNRHITFLIQVYASIIKQILLYIAGGSQTTFLREKKTKICK